jgi:tetratricopeptide (TPR) repeat protein
MKNSRLNQILNLQKEDPNNSFLSFAIALEYQACKELTLAIQYFEVLRQKDPAYLGLYYPLGKIYFELEKSDQAVLIVKEGLEWAKNQNQQKAQTELQELLNSYTDLED